MRILLDAIEIHPFVIAFHREYILERFVKPIPRCHDLRKCALGDDIATLVERDACRQLDAQGLFRCLDVGGAKALDRKSVV